MVAIPIKLYAATKGKDIAFVMLHNSCQTRVRQRRWCEYHDTFVDFGEVVKGYEYAKDQYVVMEPTDFESLPIPSVHTIEITRFVDLASIDPVHFEKSYYLEPEAVGQKPFLLLTRALKESHRVAVAKVSIRQKEHLCSLRPFGNGIIMSTMLYPDEIRPTGELEVPDDESLVSDGELQMAMMLIDQLSGEFDPDEYADEYRTALEKVIEVKLGSAEPDTLVAAPPKARVGDLMEALRASLEATKAVAGPNDAQTESEEKAATPAG
jgi:DNA end-binding protein Ku